MAPNSVARSVGESDLPCSQVFISRPLGPNGVNALGRTHYSYGFTADYFSRMLADAGVTLNRVGFPEQIKSAAYAHSVGLNTPSQPHLIFRSTEEIRVIPSAFNIACFAWEFDVLSEPGLAEVPPLDSQTSMLSMCDEIWAPSQYTKRVLQHHGFDNCQVIPCPIYPPLTRRGKKRVHWDALSHLLSCELVSESTNFLFGYEADIEQDYEALEARFAKPVGAQRRLQDVIDRGGRIFTSIVNPYDRRKNLANLIDGFIFATQDRDDAVLVLKLITSGIVERPAGYLYHQLRLILGHPHCINEDRIMLIGGYLTDLEMSNLMNGSDFYLCASIAEGQNIPILEAMYHGCLPISTRNTAMADYLTDENCVVVPERRFPRPVSGLAADVSTRRYSVDFADRFSIASAISVALSLTPAEIRRRAKSARMVVAERFGVEAVAPRVLRRLAEISATLESNVRDRAQALATRFGRS